MQNVEDFITIWPHGYDLESDLLERLRTWGERNDKEKTGLFEKNVSNIFSEKTQAKQKEIGNFAGKQKQVEEWSLYHTSEIVLVSSLT